MNIISDRYIIFRYPLLVKAGTSGTTRVFSTNKCSRSNNYMVGPNIFYSDYKIYLVGLR